MTTTEPIEDAILVDDVTQEEAFKKQQLERYEEYIRHLLANGFKNRRTAEKWIAKNSRKQMLKFKKQVKRNAGKEKPLFTVTDEELAAPVE